MTLRFIRVVVTAPIATALVACGGGSSMDSAPTAAVTQIEKPVVINLYPNSTASVPLATRSVRDFGRLGGGEHATDLRYRLRGSDALCAGYFSPASMVSATGFVFPAGQTSLTYNGITVTNQQATRLYGSDNLHTQMGNLGFAPLTFGDAQG